MWLRRASVAAVTALALGCALAHSDVARCDDGRKPAEDPDAGFLEFLGSVDRLADVNPDYLSPSAPSRAQPVNKSAPPPAPPPPPPRQALPPSASSASGAPKNE
jgi:hypothetical protein